MKVLKFYASCCGQCKAVTKEFELHPINVPIENVDAEENTELINKYKIKNIPTMILLDDNEKVVETWHGIVKSEVINNKIKELNTTNIKKV